MRLLKDGTVRHLVRTCRGTFATALVLLAICTVFGVLSISHAPSVANAQEPGESADGVEELVSEILDSDPAIDDLDIDQSGAVEDPAVASESEAGEVLGIVNEVEGLFRTLDSALTGTDSQFGALAEGAEGSYVITDPTTLAEFGLTQTSNICTTAPNTIWVSTLQYAFEFYTDQSVGGNLVATGRQVFLDVSVSGQGRDWGSGIAVSPDGRYLYALAYQPANVNASTRVFIREFDLQNNNNMRLINTGLPYRQVPTASATVNNAILNSLSFSSDGTGLYFAGPNNRAVWKHDLISGTTEEVARYSNTTYGTGWGGDFVKLATGGFLGVTNRGYLMFWPGDTISGTPIPVGRVELPSGGTAASGYGLAVVDGQVYVIDGNPSNNAQTASGVMVLPESFNPTTGGYTATTLHSTQQVLSPTFPNQSGAANRAALYDLGSAQESLGCPPINLDVSKTLVGEPSGPDAEGTYSANYEVTVTNSGGAGTYELFDWARYGENIDVEGASWTGQRTGNARSSGPFQLAPSGTAISAEATHTYNVTVNFSYSGEVSDPVTCEPNSGLFNQAVLKLSSGIGVGDDACGNPPTAPVPNTLSIVKQIVDEDGQLIPEGAVSDWQFDANAENEVLAGLPEGPFGSRATGRTDTDGNLVFQLEILDSTPEMITVTESLKESWEIFQVNGFNAVCSSVEAPGGHVAEDAQAEPLDGVSNVGDNGFSVAVPADRNVACVVQNTEILDAFAVAKRPSADQMPGINGDQSKPVINPDGSVTAYYEIVITNNGPRDAVLPAPVVDEITLPAGFTLDNVVVLDGTAPISGLTVENGRFEIPYQRIGTLVSGESKTITVEVSATVDDDAYDRVSQGDSLYRCASPTPETSDNPSALFNGVTLDGEKDEPAGTTNNQACVEPVVTPVMVEKTAPTEAVQARADGTAELVWTVRVTNQSAEFPALTGAITDHILLPEFVRSNGDATLAATAGAEVTGFATSWQSADLVPGAQLQIAESVTLAPGGTVEFTITMPVKVEATADQWTQISRCEAGSTPRQGVWNGVSMPRDTTADDNEACQPILPPDNPSIIVEKVGYSTSGDVQPLPGAEFAIWAADDQGNLVGDAPLNAIAVPVDGRIGATSFELAPGTYALVETQAPEEYNLLPTAFPFRITADGDNHVLSAINAHDDHLVTIVEGASELLIQVHDTRTGELPMTGGRGIGGYVIAALVLFAAAVAHTRRNGVSP